MSSAIPISWSRAWSVILEGGREEEGRRERGREGRREGGGERERKRGSERRGRGGH